MARFSQKLYSILLFVFFFLSAEDYTQGFGVGRQMLFHLATYPVLIKVSGKINHLY